MAKETELCCVCTDKYTPIIRKKIICKYCSKDTCSKCIEQYLLSRHEDAHCLHCRVNYNDDTLREICTKTFLQQEYFKHRQEVLINKERANLPNLQDAAIEQRVDREIRKEINKLTQDIKQLKNMKKEMSIAYNTLYPDYYKAILDKDLNNMQKLRKKLDEINMMTSEYNASIASIIQKRDEIYRNRNNGSKDNLEEKKEEDRKKFIRRCMRNGCQGFLSTAWKCGICDHYSCSKCFVVKGTTHDQAHECKKEDIETAELIKADSKPCPNCGEFINKSSGCSQMYCITCNTPWDWNTGKIVTNGVIHNPHYYEWLKRTGGNMPRNPADVPCGGFPHAWELVNMPRLMNRDIRLKFTEFHRLCMELQDISTRNFRSHLDNTTTHSININFLLGDYDEKQWGRLLASNEKKKKRDNEIQEIFAAFRMVAVELINRVQQYYVDGKNFSQINVKIAENYINQLDIEIQELIKMVNNALRTVSITHLYSVPYIIIDNKHYSIHTKKFIDDKHKKSSKISKDEDNDEQKNKEEKKDEDNYEEEKKEDNILESSHKYSEDEKKYDSDITIDEFDEDDDLQKAIINSIQTKS